MIRIAGKDIAAGLATAGLMLPEAVAYAAIAGLAPGRALVAAIAGGLAYSLIGRSRQAIISPTSSSAAILAAALAGLAGGGASSDGLATAIVAMTGAIFLLLSLFRLGSLAGFISRPVLRGFAMGLAITISIKQIPKLVGVDVPPGSIWSVLQGLAAHIGALHLASIGIGLAALGLLLALRRFPALPEAVLVLAGGIALASLVDLPALGVALAGPATLGWRPAPLPDTLGEWSHIAQLAAPIALILFAESWGTIRGMALRSGDTLSSNRELLALGVANSVSALAQGMPVGAGFSAGSANEIAGAKSRFAGVIASVALLLLAIFATGWIARIPEPVLAAVVIAALSHALSPVPIFRLFRIGRDEWIAVVATVGVLALGVLNGMLLAVALSITDLLYDLSHPSVSELGRVGDGHDFVDLGRHDDAQAVPGIAIYRPNAPLIFANAESTLAAIERKAMVHPARTVIISLEESNDFDSTAIDALAETAVRIGKCGKTLILARAHDRVREVLTASGQGDLAAQSTFSVADAVRRATSGE